MDDKQAMHAMSIDDAYHVERTLARGPSGVTELVSIDGNGPFVRKKIPSPLAQRNVWAALSACQSNRLPRVEATYELPDRFVIVYDYVPGSTLAQIAEENGRLAPNVAVQLIDQICEAVQELHQHGVIHRDITPANVIVAQDGAHLIDFGIARIRSEASNRSRDTTALGTYGFASPEQYGFAKTDARSDVFSLGRLDYAPSSAMRAHSSPANGHRASKSFARRCSPSPIRPYRTHHRQIRHQREQRTAARRRLDYSGVCT